MIKLVNWLGRKAVNISQILPDTDFSYGLYKLGLNLTAYYGKRKYYRVFG